MTKIGQLNLFAYGNFNDTELDFSRAGLHIVYGANEAGKSTTLRALRGLLFGFPSRGFLDDYRFPVQKIKVGGTLVQGTQELSIVRRKRKEGKVTTLSDPSGNTVTPDALLPFLGSVNEETFSSLYGIDQKMLRRGGEALLQGDGDVGKSLFDAAGARGVAELLESLRGEQQAIFKTNGKNPLLNQKLREWKKAKEDVKNEATNRGAYEQQVNRANALTEEIAQLKAEALSLRRRQDALQQAIMIVPALRKQQSALAALEEMGPLPALPGDATSRREQAVKRLATSSQQYEDFRRQLALTSKQLDGLVVNQVELEVSVETIDAYSRRIQVFREHRASLELSATAITTLEARFADHARQIGASGHTISLDDDGWRLTAGSIATVRDLCSKLQKAQDGLDERRGRLSAAKSDLERAETELSQHPTITDDQTAKLRAAREQARELGDLDRRIAELTSAQAALGEQLATRRKAVSLSPSLDVASLELPTSAALDELSSAQRDHTLALEQVQTKRLDRERELATIGAKLQSLNDTGAPPTEQQLAQARETRDAILADLKVDAAVPAGDLAGLRAAVQQADQLADDLRRDADRVAQHQGLTARRELLQALHGSDANEANIREHAWQETREKWLREWPAVPNLDTDSVERIRSFCDQAERMIALDQESRQMGLNLEQLTKSRTEAIEVFRRALDAGDVGARGEPPTEEAGLTVWLRHGDELIESETDALHQRRATEVMVERERKVVQQVELEQESLESIVTESWKVAGEALADTLFELDESKATVAFVTAQLDVHVTLAQLQVEYRNLQRTSDSHRDAIAAFEKRTNDWWQALSAEQPDDPADAAMQLVASHRAQTKLAEEQQRLISEQRALQIRLEQATLGRESAEGELDGLMELAKVTTLEALIEVEQRSKEQLRLRGVIDETRETVEQQAGELSAERLAEFDLDLDFVKARMEKSDLEHELDEKTATERARVRDAEGVRLGMETMGTKTRAADAASAMQVAASAIRLHLRHYVRLTAAIALLEREIEAYRSAHQDPVISEASVFFRRLTLGRYERLRVEPSADGPQRLFAHHPPKEDGAIEDGIAVHLLSEGTRDQLYLALILATLSRRAKEGAVLPLIVDDILVNFDDERKAACLDLLQELTATTQILLFTHNAHDLTIAEQQLPADAYSVHPL